MYASALWNVRYSLGTGAGYVLPLWRKTGGIPVDSIPAAPYPDDRYRTRLVWWDRATFAEDAEQAQVDAAQHEWPELAESMGIPLERFDWVRTERRTS